MAHEAFVLDGDSLADEGVALNLAAFTNEGVLLDFDEGADFGAVVYGAAVEVDEIVEDDVFTQFDVRSNSLI